MPDTNTPPNAAMTSQQLARAEEELKRNLRELAEQRVETERREAESRAAEEKRLKALGEAQADLRRELDAVEAVMMKVLPGFDQLAPRIEAARARYSQAAGELGDRFPDQPFIRHPIAKVLPWLKSFASPARSDG